MPIFLTGPRGVGKSTALEKALRDFGPGVRGLVTRFDAPREAREKDLYLLPWIRCMNMEMAPIVFRFGTRRIGSGFW